MRGIQGRSTRKESSGCIAGSKRERTTAESASGAAVKKSPIVRIVFFASGEMKARITAPNVGRKTSVVRMSAPRKSMERSASNIGLHLDPDVKNQSQNSNGEGERVVAHVPRREEADQIARQLHQEGRGICDPVDE